MKGFFTINNTLITGQVPSNCVYGDMVPTKKNDTLIWTALCDIEATGEEILLIAI